MNHFARFCLAVLLLSGSQVDAQLVVGPGAPPSGGSPLNSDFSASGINQQAENFTLGFGSPVQITQVVIWGSYSGGMAPTNGTFTLRFFDDTITPGFPDPGFIFEQTFSSVPLIQDGALVDSANSTVYRVALDVTGLPPLVDGTYFLSVVDADGATSFSPPGPGQLGAFGWIQTNPSSGDSWHRFGDAASMGSWGSTLSRTLAFEVHAVAVPEPSTYALVVASLCGLMFCGRRRKKKGVPALTE